MSLNQDDAKALKKKLKKQKRAQAKQAAAGAADASQVTGSVEGGQLVDADQPPSSKKKQRAQQLEQQPAGEEPAAEQQASKKLSKKEKKRKREAAAEVSGAAEAAQPEEKPKKAKKAKSEKQREGQEAPARPHHAHHQMLAAVGDEALAKSRPAIKKHLYKEAAAVKVLSREEIQKLRDERGIVVEGVHHLAPLTSFAHVGLPADMMHATRDFQAPSPIQAQAWPIILSGHDLIGIAATGSGKTLAFGLPALQHITVNREAGVVAPRGPHVVVLAPTRELAVQISEVMEEAGSRCKCRCVCVYGGVPKKQQVSAVRSGVEVVVATPGRLQDLMEDESCSMKEVTYLVLDEADRMLDLGFEPAIRRIVSTIRADRQTLMFSATWPTAVQKLAANFLSAPVKVVIGSQDLAASHSIKQVVEVIDLAARNSRLLELLPQYQPRGRERVIVFVLYKKEAPQVEQLLQRRGFKAAAIHGDISQDKRSAAVEAFRAGTTPILVATDVAARGLDIPDVEAVINYSFPLTTEDYVHRIGRTGRAGKTGVAHTFFCAAMDKARAGELINVLKEAGQKVPESLLKFGTAVKKKESALYGAHFKDVDASVKASKIKFDSDDDD